MHAETALTATREWVEKLRKPLEWMRDYAKSAVVVSPPVVESIVGEALDALEKLRVLVPQQSAKRERT
jgi:hypothetical protein